MGKSPLQSFMVWKDESGPENALPALVKIRNVTISVVYDPWMPKV